MMVDSHHWGTILAMSWGQPTVQDIQCCYKPQEKATAWWREQRHRRQRGAAHQTVSANCYTDLYFWWLIDDMSKQTAKKKWRKSLRQPLACKGTGGSSWTNQAHKTSQKSPCSMPLWKILLWSQLSPGALPWTQTTPMIMSHQQVRSPTPDHPLGHPLGPTVIAPVKGWIVCWILGHQVHLTRMKFQALFRLPELQRRCRHLLPALVRLQAIIFSDSLSGNWQEGQILTNKLGPTGSLLFAQQLQYVTIFWHYNCLTLFIGGPHYQEKWCQYCCRHHARSHCQIWGRQSAKAYPALQSFWHSNHGRSWTYTVEPHRSQCAWLGRDITRYVWN